MNGVVPFIKRNRSRYPDQLLCEAQGLDALRRAAAGTDIHVPAILQVDLETLTLPFIHAAECSAMQWRRLGEGLASIHSQSQAQFGFQEDNYIGLNPQPNTPSDSWGQFFLERRLIFQVSLITDRQCRLRFSGYLKHRAVRLREFLEGERIVPSLVHGDLWHGNVMCGNEGQVWLIDPAVNCGDAEVDLAMSQMFGGFPPTFYSAYRAVRPEPRHASLRHGIYNLYHSVNHLNLFGKAYREGCEAGFARLDSL